MQGHKHFRKHAGLEFSPAIRCRFQKNFFDYSVYYRLCFKINPFVTLICYEQ